MLADQIQQDQRKRESFVDQNEEDNKYHMDYIMQLDD